MMTTMWPRRRLDQPAAPATPRTFTVVAGLLLLVTAGCDRDLSGKWCGRPVETASQCVGDEVGYLELRREGDLLSGKACEGHEHDCSLLTSGSVKDHEVSLQYSFTGGTVRGTLTHEGEILAGKMFASKCNCEVPVVYHAVE